MKSLNRALIIILVAALTLSMFTITASAKTVTDEGDGTLSVGSFYEYVLYRTALSIADAANDRVEYLVHQAQLSPNPNIPLLVWRTNQISQAAICAVRVLGFDAQCVYEDYIIDGQVVTIDPIIVIKRGR